MPRPTEPELDPPGPAMRPVTDLTPGAPDTDLSDDPPAWLVDNAVVAVTWDSVGDELDIGMMTSLSGTITLAIQLNGPFTYFVISGVEFSVTSGDPGRNTIGFSYAGTKSASWIRDTVIPGASLVFGW